ncbi:MAG: hypothetical protein FJY97_02145 [candidate division Zixibacteria bacterium]|nr:hypothetical protein [candidate division Zixibacteria bacterium]
MADNPEQKQEPPKDNAMIQKFMTAYLYGLYSLRGGHFGPDEAIRRMLGVAEFADKADRFMKTWKKK